MFSVYYILYYSSKCQSTVLKIACCVCGLPGKLNCDRWGLKDRDYECYRPLKYDTVEFSRNLPMFPVEALPQFYCLRIEKNGSLRHFNPLAPEFSFKF